MTGGRRTRRFFIIALLLAFGLSGLAGRLEAGPISAFTGNTFVDSGVVGGEQGVSGTINYAVFSGAEFDPSALGLTFTPGTESSSPLDRTGYVYLFQVVNNGFANIPISGMGVEINGATPTSWGYFANTVFTEQGEGNVGVNLGVSNNLGINSLTYDYESQVPGGSGPRIGVSAVGFGTLGTAVNPNNVLLETIVPLVSYKFSIDKEVLAGMTSSVLVYTAAEFPTTVFAEVHNAGSIALGPVPGPGAFESVPEPGTLLLLGSGLIGLAARPLWRRRSEGSRRVKGNR